MYCIEENDGCRICTMSVWILYTSFMCNRSSGTSEMHTNANYNCNTEITATTATLKQLTGKRKAGRASDKHHPTVRGFQLMTSNSKLCVLCTGDCRWRLPANDAPAWPQVTHFVKIIGIVIKVERIGGFQWDPGDSIAAFREGFSLPSPGLYWVFRKAAYMHRTF